MLDGALRCVQPAKIVKYRNNPTMPLRLPRINTISRRHFFQTLPSMYAIGKDLVGGRLSFSDQTGLTTANGTTKLQPFFLSVPPAHSGITWRHVNGRSPT